MRLTIDEMLMLCGLFYIPEVRDKAREASMHTNDDSFKTFADICYDAHSDYLIKKDISTAAVVRD